MLEHSYHSRLSPPVKMSFFADKNQLYDEKKLVKQAS